MNTSTYDSNCLAVTNTTTTFNYLVGVLTTQNTVQSVQTSCDQPFQTQMAFDASVMLVLIVCGCLIWLFYNKQKLNVPRYNK